MNKGQDIQKELEGISSYMAAMPRTMPYVLPDGYFEHFDETVKEQVTAQWGKTMPFAVPTDYFDMFASDITAIATNDVSSLPKNVPYTTPPGYFNKLPEQILRSATDSSKAAIVPLRERSIIKPVRWAAAAIVILGIGLGSYFTIFTGPQDPGTERILASVPNSEILDYVQGTYRVDVNRIVSNNDINEIKLDNSDIITYLDETGWD